MNKDDEFVQLYRSISPDPASAAKVPILIDGDVKLIESQVVVEYLATKYESDGTNLIPKDPVDSAKAKIFIEAFNSTISTSFMSLFRPATAESVAADNEKFTSGLRIVDTCLKMHGKQDGGAYFLGREFSIADVCTLTIMQRMLLVMPEFRGVDVWKLMKDEKMDRLVQWTEAVTERPSAKETKPDDVELIKYLSQFITYMK